MNTPQTLEEALALIKTLRAENARLWNENVSLRNAFAAELRRKERGEKKSALSPIVLL